MSSNDRKAELERKKARLAAIREEKRRREEHRRQQLLPNDSNASSANLDVSADSSASDVRQEAEDILKDLEDKGVLPSPATKSDAPAIVGSEHGDAAPKDGSPSHMVYKSRGMVNLHKTEVSQINIAPKEQVAYNKTTQTADASDAKVEFHQLHSYDWEDEFNLGSAQTPEGEVFDFEGSPLGLPRLPNIELIGPADIPAVIPSEDKKEAPAPPRDLSEEEKQKIINSDEFCLFFDRASRVIERALAEDIPGGGIFVDVEYSKEFKEGVNENRLLARQLGFGVVVTLGPPGGMLVDIFVDYSTGPEEQGDLDAGSLLSLSRYFEDERWSRNRCVTAIDYCPQHPELLLSSYLDNEEAASDPDGIVLVWNSKFKRDTPEFIFHSQSRVVSATFAKFHPNLVLGGTYSGQICLWDNRYNKKTPVQKSPLTLQAHTHPVYSLKVVGTQNAHNLISVSNDGKLCSWSLDMLAAPQDTLELQMKQTKQVSVMSMSFPQNDVNNFIVGAEDGSVYSASRHGNKSGIAEVYEGHFAPVTGVACHAAIGQIDFSHLFLSSSFDWSCKLWSLKDSRPLYSFEDHQDYVTDVAWSPINPGLFACIDATGRIDLWNLNQDTELPAASISVEGKPALNKIMWTPSGYQLAVGDDKGKLWLYDVHEQLAIPRPDDWARVARTLHEIELAKAEAKELASTMTYR